MQSIQSGYWSFGNWKRIPFHFHWTLLLWVPWYWWVRGSLVWAAITLLASVLLLLAHELGHAIAARARQVRVHAIRLYVLHGQCEHDEPYYERDDIFIAWGGVLAQLCVLAAAFAARYAVCVWLPAWEPLLAPVFFVFIEANVLIAAINLIPVAPLDGHKAWRILRPAWNTVASRIGFAVHSVRRTLDVKKRRAIEIESQRVTAELLDRLKKK